MITIHLHDLHFHAFHGIHEEEKTLGNDYIMEASVEFHEEQPVIHAIRDTINYADIYNIILERMMEATPMMETVVMEIGQRIYEEFPEVRSICISLKKMNPPIEGIRGAAGITWQKQY